MRFIFIFILCLFSIQGFSQDSLSTKKSETWRNIYIPKTLLRTGIGYQKSLYTEVGITRRKYSGSGMFYLGTAYYGAIEFTPELGKIEGPVYGLKFGGEITLQPLLIGLETKYQTDFNLTDFVITPKIGLGDGNVTGALISYLYICYGYNISFEKRPFQNIGAHQFSLVLNPINLSYLLNKKAYSKKLYQ